MRSKCGDPRSGAALEPAGEAPARVAGFPSRPGAAILLAMASERPFARRVRRGRAPLDRVRRCVVALPVIRVENVVEAAASPSFPVSGGFAYTFETP